jgi:alpha-tubulin suppressor-like RCC1 family protein
MKRFYGIFSLLLILTIILISCEGPLSLFNTLQHEAFPKGEVLVIMGGTYIINGGRSSAVTGAYWAETKDITLTIYNGGNADLQLLAPSPVIEESSILEILEQPRDLILEGESDTFRVRITPDKPGAFSETVRILVADDSESTFEFQLEGDGLVHRRENYLGSGSTHQIFRDADGDVWVWGLNAYSQLGDGTEVDRKSAVELQSFGDIEKVEAYNSMSLAMDKTGGIWFWGNNSSEAFGSSSNSNIDTPTQIQNIPTAVDLALATGYTCILTENGQVYRCGTMWLSDYDPSPRVMTELDGIIAIEGTNSHYAALKYDGSVWTWGENFDGQLGDGTKTIDRTPRKVEGLPPVVEIAVGNNQTAALTSSGDVWYWGENDSGVLYSGSSEDVLTPVMVTNIPNARKIWTGSGKTFVQDSSGNVHVWGIQIGDGSSTPIPTLLPGLNGVVEIFCKFYSTYVLLDDGSLFAWGANDNYRLGDGTTITRTTPVRVDAFVDIVQVRAGRKSSLALSSDGTLYRWGTMNVAMIGSIPEYESRVYLYPESFYQLADVEQLYASEDQFFTRHTDGTVSAWGVGYRGNMGTGENNRVIATPMKVPGLSDIVDLATGGHYTFFLDSSGNLYGCGTNTNGILGTGSTDGWVYSPEIVPGLNSIVDVGVGEEHTVALDSDGNVWTWGRIDSIEYSSPVQVAGLSNIVEIDACEYYSMAVDNTGNIWWWGNNSPWGSSATPVSLTNTGPTSYEFFEVGHSLIIGRENDANTWILGYLPQESAAVKVSDPTQDTDFLTTQSVSAYYHGLLVDDSGLVWATGFNMNGQLGDGSYTNQSDWQRVTKPIFLW